MNSFNRYFKNVKNRNISGVSSDDELYDIAVKEFEEGEGKSFIFCECAKVLHEMPRFDPMIDPSTLVLADNSTLSKGEASNLAPPMGASKVRPMGMKAAKKQLEEQHQQNKQTHDANESMRKMAASHDKMASVMFRKQALLEKQGKLASLWKLQEYYASSNQFEKLESVMAQIESLTDALSQSDIAPRSKKPEDVIAINSDGSDDDAGEDGDSGNKEDIAIESDDDDDVGDPVCQDHEDEGDKEVDGDDVEEGDNEEEGDKTPVEEATAECNEGQEND